MAIVLHVTGDGDFEAMLIEEEYGIIKAYQVAKDNGGSVTIEVGDAYSGISNAHVSIKEFGEVDEDFVDFIRNYIQDYDSSKAENFYIIEED